MPQDERDWTNDEDAGLDYQDPSESRFSMMTGTLVALGVVTLLVFAGVVWYAYKAGTQISSSGLPVIIAAEPGETKIRPDDPGGKSFAHQDKTVYDKIDGSEATVEQLLPGAEEPVEKPQIITPQLEDLPPVGQPKVVRIPETVIDTTPPAPEIEAPEIADPMAGAPEDNVTRPVSGLPGEPATPSENAPGQMAALPPAQTEPLAAPPAGAYLLQLGSYRSQQAAAAGWKLFTRQHQAILGGAGNFISEVDLGEKGKYYRLQAGPFPDRTVANEKCAALKNAGATCILVVH